MGDLLVSFFSFGIDKLGLVGFSIFMYVIIFLLFFFVIKSVFGGEHDKKDS